MKRRCLWAVVACFVVVVGLGWVSRDFGYHWDEGNHIRSAVRTVKSGTFLPRWYRYPSLTYWINLAVLAPTAVEARFDSEKLTEELQSPAYKLRGRSVYLALTYLSLFWAALLAYRATRSPPAALLAALLLGLSFEYHYHARWMVSDTVMAQFVILGVLLSVSFLRSGRRSTLLWGAVVAGLATGTKYPGGLLLVPLGLAVLFRHRARPWTVLGLGAGILAITLLVFALTTPGCFLDWEQFKKHVDFELRHYYVRGHGPYSVEPGLDHLGRMLVYLSTSAMSFWKPVALALFALVPAGAAWLIKRDWRCATILLSLPLIYLAYFSRQCVMTVRNLQVLIPFMAVFAACGTFALASWLERPWTRKLTATALALCLLFNAAWIAYADWTIVSRKAVDWPAEIERYVRRSEDPVFLGPHVQELTGKERLLPLFAEGKVTIDHQRARRALVFRDGVRIKDASRFVANRPGTYGQLRRGPWEVNLEYYPTWAGDRRPIVISTDYYRYLAGRD